MKLATLRARARALWRNAARGTRRVWRRAAAVTARAARRFAPWAAGMARSVADRVSKVVRRAGVRPRRSVGRPVTAPARISVLVVAALGIAVAPLVLLRDGEQPREDRTPYSPPPPPPPDPDSVFLAWGPSEGDLARALETAQQMTLEEIAGLVIIARFGGTSEAGLVQHIQQFHLGGVILGSNSLISREQVIALTSAAKSAGAGEDRDWEFIVATDQEGGPVARLGSLVPVMPSFMASGAATDKAVVEDAFAGLGRDMRALGFNVDFAPVADLTIGLADPIIRTRSPGNRPDDAAETVVAAVGGLLDAGVIPSVKHFPGHGGVTADSHLATPFTTKPLADLESSDIVPFREAVQSGAPMIMMSHVAVSAWGNVPATIDPAAYAYLRRELHFTGVIVTDAMNMAALNPYGGSTVSSVAALRAGADLILMPLSTAEAHAAIVAAVNDGSLDRERLDEAASRAIALMRFQASIDPTVEVEGDYVRELSRASATVVTPLCGRALVGSSVTISGGWAYERATLSARLADYGVATGGGTTIQFLGGPDVSGSANVVVALDGPWGLSSSSATSYVALYGRGPSSLAALADILAGATLAEAQWPVSVPGLPYNPCPSPR